MRNEFKAGVFIIVCLMLFSVSIWMLGQERQIFSKQEHFFANFPDVKGLSTGAPVRLGGITIGRVDTVELEGEGAGAAVQVKILINEEFIDRIRKDTVVSIDTQGLLGDRFISLSLGQQKTPAEPGSTLTSKKVGELADFSNKAGTVLDNAVKVSDELNSVISEIKNGKGLLNTLIYDKEGGELVSALKEAANEISKASSNIKDISEEIKVGNGIAHDLVYGQSPEGMTDIVNKLNDTADNLKKVSANLANGGGTLGALLVDDELYNNLVKVTEEANRSFILKHAIRSSLEKDESLDKK